MKYLKHIKSTLGLGLVSVILIYMAAGCGGKKDKKEGASGADSSQAVCVFPGAPAYDNPPKDGGKWQANLYLGERLKFLKQTAQSDLSGKNETWLKLETSDGKACWVQASLIALAAEPAIATDTLQLYLRPDLAAPAQVRLEPFDLAAVQESKDDWLRVTVKRLKGGWIEQGWLKDKALSRKNEDIAAARLAREALQQKTPEARRAAFKKIVANKDLEGNSVGDLLDRLAEPPAAADADTTAMPDVPKE